MLSIKNRHLVLVLVLFKSLSASAGGDIGNGGDAVVCRESDGTIRSIEALDVYEGREVYSRRLSLGDATFDRNAKVELALSRLTARAPELGAKLGAAYRDFEKNSDYRSGVELPDVSDSAHLFFPRGCKVEQVIIQSVRPTFPGQKKYTINAELFSAMDSDNQAAMILHELVYEQAIRGHHSNSIIARRVNSIVFSDALLKMPLVELARELLGLMRASLDAQNPQIPIHEVRFENGFPAGSPYRGADVLLYSVDTNRSFGFYSYGTGFFSGPSRYKPGETLRYGACYSNRRCTIDVFGDAQAVGVTLVWVKPVEGKIYLIAPQDYWTARSAEYFGITSYIVTFSLR